MTHVHLRHVTIENFEECIGLKVEKSQQGLVASNLKSLAEAKVNPTYFPFAIYDGVARGYEKPSLPMIGFTMYEITAGIGFILRLMIDRSFQHRGYGRAAMIEVIRRLRLYPEVEMIATSHRRENVAASKLYHNLGFVKWDIEWAKKNSTEVFLRLDQVI